MQDQTLLALLAEIRGALLRSLENVKSEQATWRVPGLGNHILWHAGHAYVVVEWITMSALHREPVIPAGWFDLFSWESDPTHTPADQFPTLAIIIEMLREQFARLQSLFGTLTPDQLNAPAGYDPRQTAREAIVHGLQDEASHKGEIHLMRKLYALREHYAT